MIDQRTTTTVATATSSICHRSNATPIHHEASQSPTNTTAIGHARSRHNGMNVNVNPRSGTAPRHPASQTSAVAAAHANDAGILIVVPTTTTTSANAADGVGHSPSSGKGATHGGEVRCQQRRAKGIATANTAVIFSITVAQSAIAAAGGVDHSINVIGQIRIDDGGGLFFDHLLYCGGGIQCGGPVERGRRGVFVIVVAANSKI
mmetsp:Transcript_30880/g.50425  ORF Transcript_30880/g.50425 Transcript_30880/m.50425 type:complete len:205 (-) Transcript_30880:475-1089(-)